MKLYRENRTLWLGGWWRIKYVCLFTPTNNSGEHRLFYKYTSEETTRERELLFKLIQLLLEKMRFWRP